MPIISGPAQLTAPVCLGPCGRILKPPFLQPCDLCGWPLCGASSCLQSTNHNAECYYTRMRGEKIQINNFIYPHPNYQCITTLRILYCRDHDPPKWARLLKLESHDAQRQNTAKYENDRATIAEFLHRFFKLKDVFTESEILKACGILQINGHEVPLSDPPHVAVYEATSMLEHSCKPNCAKSFTADAGVVIHAALDIKKGEHLSICYADSLWGTPNRRHYLFETKFFGCLCERCKDPTEFNTYFSAVRCKECSGFQLPRTFITDENPVDEPLWYCNQCPNSTKQTQVEKMLERIGYDLNAMKKGDKQSCKLFLDYYEKLLHPNHYYLTDVRLALIQIIGQNTDEDIREKIQICVKLNSLLEVLNPAELRLRGTVLFELHAAIAESARRKTNDGQTSPYEFKDMLMRSRDALTKALQFLQHEPIELAEGQIYLQGKVNLQNLDDVLRKLCISLGDSPI